MSVSRVVGLRVFFLGGVGGGRKRYEEVKILYIYIYVYIYVYK